MKNKFNKICRKMLVREIEATQEMMDKIRIEVRESHESSISCLQNLHDSSVSDRDLRTNTSIYKMASQKLTLLQKALEAFDNGTYGKCSCCGEMISEERLIVSPTSNLCMTCQETFEKEAKLEKHKFVRTPGLQYMPFLPFVA